MRRFELPGRSVAYGTEGMAATSSPLATLAALDVLRGGGNAVDAAVTASAVLCITEPHMTGIGGDCFALIGEANGKVLGLNGSGRSARAADQDWLKASKLTRIDPLGVHAVTVPGAVDAWERLLKRCGTMDLREALAPAIRFAEAGVPVTPRVARDWPKHEAQLKADQGGFHFLKDGRAPREGEIMTYPALAATLRLLAAKGAEAFYRGTIAEEIVQHLKARGGLLSLADFASTEASWVEPIATSFAGHEILEIPPNGQGLTALIALNILSHTGMARHDPMSPERYHLMIEALKLAWVMRNRHIADSSAMVMPVETLLSAGFAAKLAQMIDMRRALDVRIALPGSDTVYLSVVDRKRQAVSFINSIYWGFGSGIVTPHSAVALQNRGAGFVTDPSHPNCIGPGKRPLHTIIPAMAKKGQRVDMTFGVMGGNYQPMGHMMVATNRYIYRLDLQESLDMPRVFPEEGELLAEASVPAGLRDGLEKLGHKIVLPEEALGGGQAITIDWDRGVLAGGSDCRKDGLAMGY